MKTIQERIEVARVQEFLTVEELALLIRLNPQTIYRKAKKGDIPGVVRFGRSIRFIRVSALAWGRRAALARSSSE